MASPRKRLRPDEARGIGRTRPGGRMTKKRRHETIQQRIDAAIHAAYPPKRPTDSPRDSESGNRPEWRPDSAGGSDWPKRTDDTRTHPPKEKNPTPLEQLTTAIRDVLTTRAATREQIETLRQLSIHVIDFDTSSADEIRAALRDALDVANRPDARSFATDSGIGASRATF
jgi:hypothetical protein